MKKNPDTLFYDGQCPLCTREIRLLAKLCDDRLALIDIHSIEQNPDFPDTHSLLSVLHMRTADGRWITGVQATVKAWSHTRMGFLWKPLTWPIIRDFAARIYHLWAKARFTRLYGASCRAES
jgi:predicted DCC family thiol-disulfide oxidoreductase YuxK